MKKVLSILLVTLLVLLCGCNKQSTSSGDESDNSVPTEYIYEDNESENSSNPSSEASSNNTSSKKDDSSSSSKKEPTKLYEDVNQGNIDVPPLKIPGIGGSNSNNNNNNNNNNSSSTPSNTTERKTFNTPIGEFYEDAIGYYKYDINGTFTDWFTEDDLFHFTTKNSNRYISINSSNGKIVKDVALSGRPAEMHNKGDEIWISYPDLKCIKKHDKETLSVKETITLNTEVHSFDIYNDYLVYAEDDQSIQVYRYNLKTGESVRFPTQIGFYFSESDVIINKELKLVYICEYNSTGSAVYCFELESMELKSKYRKDNYGYSNGKRRSFLSDGSLFWGEFRLDASNVSIVQAQYSSQYSAGMLHVDDFFVCTTKGIFLKETCEMLLPGSSLELAAITASGNIIVGDRSNLFILLGQ